MPEIMLDNVSKTFNNGKITALAGVNLSIKEGDYAFILGPSGCGKTTLLRIIAGLETPTTGRVLIESNDVTRDPPQSRGIAFVFQHFEIFDMTVWENCTYPLKVTGASDEEILHRGEHALSVVGLLDKADEVPEEWGNGEMQRLGIARAICSGAKILIMDEPLGSLDPKISLEFRWELRNIIKDQRLTAIQVTHNQEEAMSIGDKIIIMRDGRLLQYDTPEHIYEFPRSVFVGNFLGGMNFLSGYISHIANIDDFSVKVRLGGPELPARSKTDRFALDENIILGLRYEDVYMFPLDYDFSSNEDLWHGINVFHTTLKEKFLTGKEKIFILELDTGDTLQANKPEVFRYKFNVGDTVKTGIFTDDLRIFKYPPNLQKELDLQ
jgi:ABC-type Fe3+/spermidine/putrescine transport system ATPase subunit